MKKSYLLSLLSMAVLLFASCADSPESLSASRLKRIVKKEMQSNCLTDYYVSVKTGYYEENDPSERESLMKLKEAGLITYEVKRFAWYDRVTDRKTRERRVPLYFWGTVYDYTTEYYTSIESEVVYNEHFFVTVELTPKGRKIMVDSLPQPDGDKDAVSAVYDKSQYPEDAYVSDENWSEVHNPFAVVDTAVIDEVIKEEVAVAEEVSVEEEKPAKEAPTYPIYEYGNKAMRASYADAMKNEKENTVFLKAFSLKVYKARKIQVRNTEEGDYAKAEIILNVANTTHAGHILFMGGGVYDGIRMTFPVEMTYYCDKGWSLNEDWLENFPSIFRVNLNSVLNKFLQRRSKW